MGWLTFEGHPWWGERLLIPYYYTFDHYACHCFLRYSLVSDFHSGGIIVRLFHFVLISASFARLFHKPRGFRGKEDHRARGERGLSRDAGVVPDVQSHELVHFDVEGFRQRGQRELELLMVFYFVDGLCARKSVRVVAACQAPLRALLPRCGRDSTNNDIPRRPGRTVCLIAPLLVSAEWLRRRGASSIFRDMHT